MSLLYYHYYTPPHLVCSSVSLLAYTFIANVLHYAIIFAGSRRRHYAIGWFTHVVGYGDALRWKNAMVCYTACWSAVAIIRHYAHGERIRAHNHRRWLSANYASFPPVTRMPAHGAIAVGDHQYAVITCAIVGAYAITITHYIGVSLVYKYCHFIITSLVIRHNTHRFLVCQHIVWLATTH